MRKSLLSTLLLAATVAACASNPAPPRPAPFDPTGIYDFSTNVEGFVVNGTFTVREGANGLTGVVTSDATDPLTLSTVSVEDRTITGTGSTPEGAFTITLTVEEDGSVSGGWSLGPMGGTATGRKRAGG